MSQQQQQEEERRRQEEERVNAYADAMFRKDLIAGGFYAAHTEDSGWLYGMGERPYNPETPKEKK